MTVANNRIPKYGYIGPLHVRNIPIYIHWTFPVGGLFIAFFLGNVSWETAPPMVAAYTTLILVHELGHALAARAVSSKVYAVLITGAGGWCFADLPDSFFSRLLFYAGGILAQLLALFLTVSLITLFGSPDSLILDCFVLVFTVVNVILIVLNILPSEGTDGKKLWELFKGYRGLDS